MKPLSVDSETMRRLDKEASIHYAMPSLLLMENAGRGIAELVCREYPEGPAVIFSGRGNNGGDGFAAARHLVNRGMAVTVVLFCKPGELAGDALTNYMIARQMGVPVLECTGDSRPFSALKEMLPHGGCAVDGLFGTGLRRPIKGEARTAIEFLNAGGRNVVAIDVPSGIHPDTGEILGTAVKAVVTAALALPKTGLYQAAGPDHAGRIEVIDIGMPKNLLDSVRIKNDS